MEKIFANSEEKFVKKVVIYGKASDAYAYSDADCTKKIKAADLLNAAKKGMLVKYAGVFYNPVAIKEASGVVTIFVYTADASNPAVVSLKSEE